MIRIKRVLTVISFISVSFIYGQVNVFTSGFTGNILQDYEFVFGVGNVNMTAGNINTATVTGFDVVIVNSIDQGYNAGVIPKLVNYVNNGGHVILSTEGGTAGGNQLMSTVWNNVSGQNITETASWAAGTGTPPRYHNSDGPWSSSPDAQMTGATGSYASFGNMSALNVIHQRLLSPPTCDNIEAMSAAFPSHPNLGDGTLYIQGEVQFPFLRQLGSAECETHARALARMHFALLNNDQVLLDDLNTWTPNLAVDTNFLSVRDTAFCDLNFTPFTVTAPTNYDTYSWEDTLGNVLGTNSSINISQSGMYIIRTTGTPPTCDGIDTLIVEVDSLTFTSTSTPSCLNTQEGEIIIDNVSANYLAYPVTYSLNSIAQPSDSLFTNLSPGSYNVTVQDARGCIDSATVAVSGLEVPSPNFTFDTVCLGDLTSFTDLSTITNGNISNWEWTIDNTSDFNQNTSYNLNSLNNLVQLYIVSDAGCMDSIIQNVIVHPLPEATITGDIEVCQDAPAPQITFTGSNSAAPYTFTYTINGGAQQTVTSTGNTATVNVPTNTMGTYTYELISVEDASTTSCNQLQPDTATVVVYTLPEAIWNVDDECFEDLSEFVDNSTVQGVHGDIITNWEWDFGDGSTSTAQNPSLTYGGENIYDVELIVTTNYGCTDTLTQTATVWPLPSVDFSPTDVCLEFDTEFTDESTISNANTTNSNVQWDWNFGDGGVMNIQNPNYTYQSAGVFNATLTVTSNNGCVNDTTLPVTVNPKPEASFVGLNLEGCSPVCPEIVSTSTVDTPSTLSEFEWRLGSTVVQSGPSGSYGECLENNSGSTNYYDLELKVTTTEGCVDTFIQSDYIKVYHNPIANFNFNPEEPDVMNTEIRFLNSSSFADLYDWDFYFVGSSSLANPTIDYPAVADDYDVRLVATTDQGCSDTARAVVTIKDKIVFYVPNTFTPDGDAINSTFQPIFTSGFEPRDINLLIFNRWGEIVYETNNINKGWDGYYQNQPVPEGTYVWKIEFTETMSDKRYIETGHVNVLR